MNKNREEREQELFESMPKGTVEELLAVAKEIMEFRNRCHNYDSMLNLCNQEIMYYTETDPDQEVLERVQRRKKEIEAEGLDTLWKIETREYTFGYDEITEDHWVYNGKPVAIIAPEDEEFFSEEFLQYGEHGEDF